MISIPMVMISLGFVVILAIAIFLLLRWWWGRKAGTPSSLSSLGMNVSTKPKDRALLHKTDSGCSLFFGIIWTAFSLIFVIVPLGLLVSETYTAILLQSAGETTEGVIMSRRIDEDSEGDTYYITYQYWVPIKGDKTRLTREESVTHSVYNVLPPETRVQILYLPPNPETARMKDHPKIWEPVFLMFFMLFGSLFVAIGVWLVYTGWRGMSNGRLLNRRGKITTGRVTKLWIDTDSDGDKDHYIAFSFSTPKQLNNEYAEINRNAYNTLQVGDSVQVYYVPGKPEICRLEI